MQKAYPIVAISWLDAEAIDDLPYGSLDVSKIRAIPVTSVGFLLDEDKERVVLGQNAYSAVVEFPGHITSLILIPTGMITDRFIVEGAKVTVTVADEDEEGGCACGTN